MCGACTYSVSSSCCVQSMLAESIWYSVPALVLVCVCGSMLNVLLIRTMYNEIQLYRHMIFWSPIHECKNELNEMDNTHEFPRMYVCMMLCMETTTKSY